MRPPVTFKLLRAPGETLRRRMAAYNEDFIQHVGKWALLPLGLTALPLIVWPKLVRPSTSVEVWAWGGVSVVVFALSFWLSLRPVWQDLQRYKSDKLGYLGERYVGELLAGLLSDGFRVFHDIPAQGAQKTFNLDHVVVGPTGLWLVETKTRSKGPVRPGFKDHEVSYDGTQLIWPWGEDRHGLEQAVAEARWLGEWVKIRTGIDCAVRPILTLPGWMVREQRVGPVRVLNPKNLGSAIRARGEQVLTPAQIDLIARQLDLVCRDVED